MKIFNSTQIKKGDSFSIQNEPISSLLLMERAVNGIYKELKNEISKDLAFHIFCGPGDNGGDGLMFALKISEKVSSIFVYTLENQNQRTEDNELLLLKVKSIDKINLQELKTAEEIQDIKLETGIIIDALFGIGLNRPLDGLIVNLVEKINESNIDKVAIDIPSGLFADNVPKQTDCIVKANRTLTFQSPKWSFFFPESFPYTGVYKTINIGIHPEFFEQEITDKFLINKTLIKTIYKVRSLNSNKSDYGKALIAAAGLGKNGASILTTQACLRSGAGLTTAFIPQDAYTMHQTSCPEAMVILSNDSQSLDDSLKNWNFDSVGAGPGIGTNESATKFIKSLLQNYKKPIVLDADALNILSQNKDLYSQIPPNSILTPHPKEFDRLTQPHSSHFRRLETAVQFAYSNQVVVILKNAVTFIISPDKNIYINDQRNPGLAKGGSGDVLTGIITALLAQEYTPTHAAILGVYIHSFAAKKARKKIAVESLIATDIIQNISKAFRKLNQ